MTGMLRNPSLFRLPLFLMLVVVSLAAGSALAQDMPGVQLAKVERSDILRETQLNGTVTALRSARLSTSVAGLIDSVNVEAGARVDRGEIVMELDTELAELSLARARAQSQEAQAALQDARRRLEEAQSVGVGRNIAATEVRSRESAVATAEATLARLRATQEREAALLRRHNVEAPFRGTVSQRYADLGEWVSLGTELLELVDLDSVRIDFEVPQGFYNRIDDNSRLLVQIVGLDDSRDEKEASIEAVVPVTDPQARTFLLRARPPEEVAMLPGMAIQGTLIVQSGQKGLTVPRDTLIRYPDGRVTVWIAEKTDASDDEFTVREKRLRLGSGFRNQVVVEEGLEEGLHVVSRGNESLREGMTVRLSERNLR